MPKKYSINELCNKAQRNAREKGKWYHFLDEDTRARPQHQLPQKSIQN